MFSRRSLMTNLAVLWYSKMSIFVSETLTNFALCLRIVLWRFLIFKEIFEFLLPPSVGSPRRSLNRTASTVLNSSKSFWPFSVIPTDSNGFAGFSVIPTYESQRISLSNRLCSLPSIFAVKSLCRFAGLSICWPNKSDTFCLHAFFWNLRLDSFRSSIVFFVLNFGNKLNLHWESHKSHKSPLKAFSLKEINTRVLPSHCCTSCLEPWQKRGILL